MIHICLLEGNEPNAGPIQQVVVYILKKGTQKIICTKQAIFKTLHVTISATTAVELHANIAYSGISPQIRLQS